jgi:hypothetical protein
MGLHLGKIGRKPRSRERLEVEPGFQALAEASYQLVEEYKDLFRESK